MAAIFKKHGKEILKTEKAHCGTEKSNEEEMEKKEAKPDFLDLDGDGNKKESMKQAAKDKKARSALLQRIE